VSTTKVKVRLGSLIVEKKLEVPVEYAQTFNYSKSKYKNVD